VRIMRALQVAQAERKRRKRTLADYFVCRHREFKDVLLNSALVIAPPGGGKTALINHIIHEINTKYSQYEQLNILTRFLDELFKVPVKSRYEELRERIRTAEVINIFIDDALTSLHSQKRKRDVDINWAVVRHVVRMVKSGAKSIDESYLMPVEVPCTLNVFFATQRYQLLSPQMREACNVLIAKAVDLNPTYDNKNMFLQMLGDEAIEFLRYNAYLVHTLKDREAMSWFVIKVIGQRAKIGRYTYTGAKPEYEVLAPEKSRARGKSRISEEEPVYAAVTGAGGVKDSAEAEMLKVLREEQCIMEDELVATVAQRTGVPIQVARDALERLKEKGAVLIPQHGMVCIFE